MLNTCCLVLVLVMACLLGCVPSVPSDGGDAGAQGGEGGAGGATISTVTITATDCPCFPAPECHVGICGNGICATPNAPDGHPCNTTTGVCEAGVCNPCKQRICGASTCEVLNATNGTACGNDSICVDGECHL